MVGAGCLNREPSMLHGGTVQTGLETTVKEFGLPWQHSRPYYEGRGKQMTTDGRTKAEYRRADGTTACFGTLPPYKPNLPKNTLDGNFGGIPVKLRWDKLGNDTVASILFLSENDVEVVRGMSGFQSI